MFTELFFLMAKVQDNGTAKWTDILLNELRNEEADLRSAAPRIRQNENDKMKEGNMKKERYIERSNVFFMKER